jgi:hypothetical protein
VTVTLPAPVRSVDDIEDDQLHDYCPIHRRTGICGTPVGGKPVPEEMAPPEDWCPLCTLAREDGRRCVHDWCPVQIAARLRRSR